MWCTPVWWVQTQPASDASHVMYPCVVSTKRSHVMYPCVVSTKRCHVMYPCVVSTNPASQRRESCDVPLCGEYKEESCDVPLCGEYKPGRVGQFIVLYYRRQPATGVMWCTPVWWVPRGVMWCTPVWWVQTQLASDASHVMYPCVVSTNPASQRRESCDVPLCGEYKPERVGQFLMFYYWHQLATGVMWCTPVWWVPARTTQRVPGVSPQTPTSDASHVMYPCVVSTNPDGSDSPWCFTIHTSQWWGHVMYLCCEYKPGQLGQSLVFYHIRQPATRVMWCTSVWWVQTQPASDASHVTYPCVVSTKRSHVMYPCVVSTKRSHVMYPCVVSTKRSHVMYLCVVSTNPDGSDSSLCFTTDASQRRESCDVPLCGEYQEESCDIPLCGEYQEESCDVPLYGEYKPGRVGQFIVLYYRRQSATGVMWCTPVWWVPRGVMWCTSVWWVQTRTGRTVHCALLQTPVSDGSHVMYPCVVSTKRSHVMYPCVVSTKRSHVMYPCVVSTNPDGLDRCFTTDASQRRESCDVPLCGEYQEGSCDVSLCDEYKPGQLGQSLLLYRPQSATDILCSYRGLFS